MTGTPSVLASQKQAQRSDPPDPVLVRIRDLIYKVSGIYLADNKMFFLEERAKRRLQALKIGSFRSYLDLLTLGRDRDAETRSLLNEITVGETCFFRNMPQLNAVQKTVIPKILQARRSAAPLRIWSAGCSTGEEPYTLAIVLMELVLPVLRSWSWEIIATDLNDRSLAKAQEAVYDGYAVRNVEPAILLKYFQRQADRFVLSQDVKKHVAFSRLNLLDDPQILAMKGFDILFCANVLIYFDSASKRTTVHHFFDSLSPGGYFFLGHAESLFGISEEFQLIHFPGATAYCRPAPAASSGGPR